MTWEIFQGDHLEIMPKHIEDESIDLTVTSPPYDNLRDYDGYHFNFEGLAKELYRVTKPGGVVVWVVGDTTVKGSETLTSFNQAICFKGTGFNVHDTMIYLKDGFTFPESNRYPNVFEYMFVFSKGAPRTFNPLVDRQNRNRGRKLTGTDRQKSGELKKISGYGKELKDFGVRFNVWNIANQKKNGYHPAPFPEQLVNDHIISWSNPGDLVLDPMAGSGTVLKVAEQLGRNSIGIEISEEYCDIIKKRMANFQMTIFNV